MLKGKLFSALVALTLTAAALPAQAGQKSPAEAEADSMVAAITGAAGKLGRQANIPATLSETDEQLYRAAFQAQDRNQWAYADQMAQKVHDPVLLGPLLAERYLSDAYHPSAAELKDWMARYAELPQAEAVHDLARQKLGAQIATLRAPIRGVEPTTASLRDDDTVSTDFAYEAGRALGAAERRRLDATKDKFRDLLHDEQFDAAIAALDGSELRRVFDKVDYDEMKTALAQSLFVEGRDEEALHWAAEAAERSGDLLPEAHWLAGLSLWRSDKRADSLRHFEAVANSPRATPTLHTAGAYWAARASLAARRPEVVNHWLLQAAASPRSFYGLLARRALGQDIQFSWETRPFTDLDAEVLTRTPAAHRALALLQVGDRSAAEEELRTLAPTASPALAQSMLALSSAADMPDLTVGLSGLVAAQDGRLHDSAAYPVPNWRPTSGWTIDRALVLAIARQESALNPNAKSPSGATGLMQLMPRTAKFLGSSGKLTDPQVNLELGQRYVRHLLDDSSVKGNLLFLVASYNSGPGNVGKWLQAMHHNGDALLFMESIPVRETRSFVQKVMTNFWTYRNRLGQDSPSLDAIAAGAWPMYDSPGATVRQARF